MRNSPGFIRMKDRREISSDKHHRISYEAFVASLVIKDASEMDAGSYTCEASNDLGSVTTSGVLEIQGKTLRKFFWIRNILYVYIIFSSILIFLIMYLMALCA